MGMYLMRQIGTRGVYGDPILPDFMVFLNWHELPWFWYGMNHFWFAMLIVITSYSIHYTKLYDALDHDDGPAELPLPVG